MPNRPGMVPSSITVRCSTAICSPIFPARNDSPPVDVSAVDGLEEIVEQRPGDARLEHHRHLLRRDLARVQAAQRPVGRDAPHVGRVFERRRGARAEYQ